MPSAFVLLRFDDQLEFGRLLYGQIGAFQNPALARSELIEGILPPRSRRVLPFHRKCRPSGPPC